MKAMIFAAGYGKRLHPLTLETPKPLIEVKGKPVIYWVVQQLIDHGFSEIIVNTHYLADQVKTYLQSTPFNASFTISHEEELLGTGGGLAKTVSFWNDDDFYLCNADILCTANLSHLMTFHQEQGALVTLATNQVTSASMLLVDEANDLVGLRSGMKDRVLAPSKGKIRAVGFCGMQVISPKYFTLLETPVQFSIIDQYLGLIEKGYRIATWDIGEEYWEDIGTTERLETANRQFPETLMLHRS